MDHWSAERSFFEADQEQKTVEEAPLYKWLQYLSVESMLTLWKMCCNALGSSVIRRATQNGSYDLRWELCQ